MLWRGELLLALLRGELLHALLGGELLLVLTVRLTQSSIKAILPLSFMLPSSGPHYSCVYEGWYCWRGAVNSVERQPCVLCPLDRPCPAHGNTHQLSSLYGVQHHHQMAFHT